MLACCKCALVFFLFIGIKYSVRSSGGVVGVQVRGREEVDTRIREQTPPEI